MCRPCSTLGAFFLGKTNLDQFATGLVGVRSPYGTPRNVFDPARVPGGSSSGSACVVAAGIAAFALGTDTAGSGRVPAMFGNIVGLKPTIGSVSARGMVPACRSIDTVSVFARTVDEALAVARVIAGPDEADAYSRSAPYPYLRRSHLPESPMAAMRVACVASDLCDTGQGRLYRQAAAAVGAEEVDIAPLLGIARLLYDGPWVAERTAALRNALTAPDTLHPVTRAILESGLERRTVDAFDAFHQLALARRFAARLFTRFDALMLPTAPNTPTLAEVAADPIGPNSRLGTWTNFVNLCDLAGWSVPAGIGPDGLPAGVTVLGPAWSEGRLAALADQLHRSTTSRVGATEAPLPPPAPADPLAPDETALFCIGGHMAGLPLNGQLTTLGGRFVAEARTRPLYRLHDLGSRPGMVGGARGWRDRGRNLGAANLGGGGAAGPSAAAARLWRGPARHRGVPGVSRRGGRRARRPRHHASWRLARLSPCRQAEQSRQPIRCGRTCRRAPASWDCRSSRPGRRRWRPICAPSLAQGALLTEPALPDVLDPAPVYRA